MRASNFYVGFGLVTLSGCLWFLACAPFDLGPSPLALTITSSLRSLLKELEHDPEKWNPVFRKHQAQKKLERDADRTTAHPALAHAVTA